MAPRDEIVNHWPASIGCTEVVEAQEEGAVVGSLDDGTYEVIDTEKTMLTVLVYPDGAVRIQSKAKRADGKTDHAWVAETLRRIAAAEEEQS